MPPGSVEKGESNAGCGCRRKLPAGCDLEDEWIRRRLGTGRKSQIPVEMIYCS